MLGLLINQGLRTDELAKREVNHTKLREGKIDVPGGVRSNGRIMKLESHQVMKIVLFLLFFDETVYLPSKNFGDPKYLFIFVGSNFKML